MVMDMVRKFLIVFSFLFLAGLSAFSQPSLTYGESAWQAKQGNPRAQAFLAYYLKNGIDIDKNLDEAKEWASSAALSQDGLAYWLLAQIGREKGDDPYLYRDYLYKALACKYPLAFSIFGRLNEAGSPEFEIEKDEQMAFSLLQRAADEGDAEAAAYVGYLYLKRENDPVNAFKYLHQAASKGDAESMGLLAGMLDFGVGTDPDPKAAFEWYQKAAAAGSQAGILGLAECYRLGLGTSPDYKEAFSYYLKSSSSSPLIQFILGYSYAMGEGTEQDVSKALSLFRQSADSGNVFAQALLGTAQFEGVIPFKDDKDVSKAFPFLKSAYDNQDFERLPASFKRNIYRYLSGYYRFGRGVGRNVAFADELMKKADALPEEDPAPSLLSLIGKRSFDECLNAYVQTPLSSPETILEQVSFDYPVPEFNQTVPAEKKEESVPDKKTEQPVPTEKKEVSVPKSEPRSVPQTVSRPTTPVIPPKQVTTSSFDVRFVLSANAAVISSVDKEKAIATGMSIGAYDIAGSRIGAEAGAYFCPVGITTLASDGHFKNVSPYGFDAALVFRAGEGIYPKAGIGYFSYKETPKDSPDVNGLCGILGLSVLLGKHFCLELGVRYYPETKVMGGKSVSTWESSYLYPTMKTLFKGFSPMAGIGWAF